MWRLPMELQEKRCAGLRLASLHVWSSPRLYREFVQELRPLSHDQEAHARG